MKHLELHLAAVIAALALSACGGSGAPSSPIAEGPLAIGIVSGQNQVAPAGAKQLPAPVVGKLVRQPNGTVTFIETSANRALDLVVPRAFAQSTVVTGSPVPNAVVCAVSVDTTHALTPFTPCTNTDANGQATFFFTPGVHAGVAKAEIRGSLNNQPAVFDTAKATVTADTASINSKWVPDSFGPAVMAHDASTNTSWYGTLVHASATLDLTPSITWVGDKYNNPITGATVGWTLEQLSNETLSVSGPPGNQTVSSYPVVTAAPPSAPAHIGTAVTGLAPGWARVTLYLNGHLQGALYFAVVP